MVRNVAIVLLSTFRLTHTQISSTNQRAYTKFARWKKRNTYISHVLDDGGTKGWQSDAAHFSDGSHCVSLSRATDVLINEFCTECKNDIAAKRDLHGLYTRETSKGDVRVSPSRKSSVETDQDRTVVVIQAKRDEQTVSFTFPREISREKKGKTEWERKRGRCLSREISPKLCKLTGEHFTRIHYVVRANTF